MAKPTPNQNLLDVTAVFIGLIMAVVVYACFFR
jgi:hypothetical protein